MIHKISFFVLFMGFGQLSFAQQTQDQQHRLQSPDGKITANVNLKEQLSYAVYHDGDQVIAWSPISMHLSNGEAFGIDAKLKSLKTNSVDKTIASPIYKRAEVQDHYNELVLDFKGNYSVTFRAYNDGVAYRFSSAKRKDYTVAREEVTFNFSKDFPAIVSYVKGKEKRSIEQQFNSSFENTYTHTPLSGLIPNRLALLPVVIEVGNGKKVAITEADLEDYPGLYLINESGENTLTGVLPAYPKKVQQGGHNQLQLLVKEREDYIAKAKGTRQFPWRAMIISTSDKQLADNDMVYKLAAPSRIRDDSWIKPGKVAWDWWNAWNIHGVDFEAGVNNDTYKYYIDFASSHDIRYVILDEGWAVNLQADLMQVVPEIDLEELIAYAKERNVDIILWAGFYAFDRDMENVAKHYASMGVKGFKVDFMDRDDQQAVDFFYRVAEMGAKYKLLIDFHGAYKPTGLQRTYPNVINFEGVHGLEQMKWAGPEVDQVTYDVTMPFIRMLAGPVDYTQGAMRNASKENYRPIFEEPMSQGTRTRQLAQYVVYESPLNMLADNPTIYMKEKESTQFIAAVPEVWDETRALDGKIAEYIAIARRKGDQWYVAALTNWDAREMELDLSFLGEGSLKAEVFRDGVNAHRVGSDYKRQIIDLPPNRKIKFNMAPGGGYVARIYRE